MLNIGTITLAIAVLGAVLGIINTWQALDRDRVKLLVIPKMAFGVGGGSDGRIRPCIEVINRSSFAVSVGQIGYMLKWSKKRIIALEPIISSGGTLPKRLDSRSSFTIYFYPETVQQSEFRRVRCAFAETECGVLVTGNSAALKSLIKHVTNKN